jgi:signal recognition particle receptor subunit beta
MAVIVVAEREIHAKIVYYGPGLSGKTTNLAWIYDQLPAEGRSALISIDTDEERTLFFDFLPISVSQVGDYRLRLHLYSVPGQERFATTRAAMLRGVDGIVFVVDAQRDRITENERSLDELTRHLREQGRTLEAIPLVLQYNKQDLANALSKPQLDAQFNPRDVPAITASATTGHGVADTLQLIVQGVVRNL